MSRPGEPQRPSRDLLLEESIARSMEEIKDGANADDFKDLTILNFMLLAKQRGYTLDEIRDYIQKFSYELEEEEE